MGAQMNKRTHQIICVVVEYYPPPIPDRHHDWSAYEERRDEEQPQFVGWGSTREEAVDDMFEKLLDDPKYFRATHDGFDYGDRCPCDIESTCRLCGGTGRVGMTVKDLQEEAC